MFLFSITCSLGPSSSWLWLIPVNSGPWETWLDLGKRVDRECWCDVQILPVPFSANIQGVQLGEHFVVRQIVSIFLLEFPVFFIVEVCVCVCNVSWLSLFPVILGGHCDIPLYKKQTAPTSTPNSWSAPPMSIGAMSTIGRREVFCVLYSKTVLPHRPVCFCWLRVEKCVNSNLTIQWQFTFK